VFIIDIVRLHGIPQSIVLDRDQVFTSIFWKELMRLAGVKLHMTSAFHPQSDGQTEAANKVIVMYIRCLTGDHPRQMAALAAMGGIHLQYCFPVYAEDNTILDCLRPRAPLHSLL
jgi:hypothetical protein